MHQSSQCTITLKLQQKIMCTIQVAIHFLKLHRQLKKLHSKLHEQFKKLNSTSLQGPRYDFGTAGAYSNILPLSLSSNVHIYVCNFRIVLLHFLVYLLDCLLIERIFQKINHYRSRQLKFNAYLKSSMCYTDQDLDKKKCTLQTKSNRLFCRNSQQFSVHKKCIILTIGYIN